ncbi:hypothetical protein [Streptomyces sp. NRRL F-4474]|uniref:hypothetical protein n=1 Tax=Streptomyces sp. NRRL F-4474 TaxID=1463851 RepID=UPI0004C495FE|nr:hypothetical protein [Streptomyces sp. NRRL F-4474]
MLLLWIPMLLVVPVLTIAAPIAAVRATAELTRRLSKAARISITVLAVAVSLWWLAVPSLRWATFGAVMSWLAVAMMTVEANYRRRARRAVMPPTWNQAQA